MPFYLAARGERNTFDDFDPHRDLAGGEFVFAERL
jgi:hypothetical protein